MAEANFALIDEGRAVSVTASVSSDHVRLSPTALRAALGWELKPQGLCKEDRCISLAGHADMLATDGIDLVGVAALLSRPLALDIDARVAYLGTPAADRAAQLASLEAPNFTLPDLAGQQHALSDYRGKKVLLVAYASW